MSSDETMLNCLVDYISAVNKLLDSVAVPDGIRQQVESVRAQLVVKARAEDAGMNSSLWVRLAGGEYQGKQLQQQFPSGPVTVRRRDLRRTDAGEAT